MTWRGLNAGTCGGFRSDRYGAADPKLAIQVLREKERMMSTLIRPVAEPRIRVL